MQGPLLPLIGLGRLICAAGQLCSRAAASSQRGGLQHVAEASCSYLPSSLDASATPGLLWRSSAFCSLARGYSNGPDYAVGLHNLRDNPGATRQHIRVGRGDSGRRGNYSGRGMKGQKARGRGLHLLYDGGQLGLLKFPVTRQKPPYEVLYNQLGLSRVVEFVQLGLLDPSQTITMKELYDSGCLTSNVKYGVLLYGKARLTLPLDIQVTACDAEARSCVETAGGSVTRVYYTKEGLQGLMHPEKYTSRNLPLPLPAAGWHPKHASKFDAIGQIPPTRKAAPAPWQALPAAPTPARGMAVGTA